MSRPSVTRRRAWLVGQTQTFSDGVHYDEYRIGGTSLASPLYAGHVGARGPEARRLRTGQPDAVAARGTTYDVTKAPRRIPRVVRVDFNNSENGTDGYTYSARWFDWDEPLTIHVRPGYDDVTGVGAPDRLAGQGHRRSPVTSGTDTTESGRIRRPGSVCSSAARVGSAE